ncbi:MAG: cytochrome C oxidase subunit I [Tateyamaria sp.]|uniref:cytochrome C oxidase subunit I n=1 Tax=Tateyamaria sp. TaxID=1929288 RepID=UPI00328D31B9
MQTTILLITLVLMAATLAMILRALWATDGPPPSEDAPKTRTRMIWGLVVFGVIVSVASLREWPHTSAGSDAMVVKISSGQWWWDTDTTEIPLGQQIEFHVTSEDVNHGLGIYDSNMRLVVQVQAMPTYTNKVVHTFDTPGSYRILCMEFCGIAHHDMVSEFEVLEGSS